MQWLYNVMEMDVTSFCGEMDVGIHMYIHFTSTLMHYLFLPHSLAGAVSYGEDFVGYFRAHRQACGSILLYSLVCAQPEFQDPLQGSGHFSLSNIYQLNILDGSILTTNEWAVIQ